MIDTIKLTTWLNRPLRRDSLPFQLFKENEKGVITGILNPTAQMKKLEVYLPRITYTERPIAGGKSYQLSFELSLPKLMFGNNFSELTNEDLPAIVAKIRDALKIMGVGYFFSWQIEDLEVGKIDYSKNIIFTDNTTASEIIGIVKMADIPKIFDIQDNCFKNGGKVLHIHTNSEDIAIYDKIADLRQSKISEKRATGKDNLTQLNLLDEFDRRRELSVIRFEARLNSKRKIRDELQKLGINAPLTLSGLFSSEISREILLEKWKKIYQGISKCELDTYKPEQLLANILRESNSRPTTALAKLGWLYIEKEAKDMRSIRNLFDSVYGRHSWSRLKKIREPPRKAQLKSLLLVNQSITDMKPVNLRDYNLGLC